ncbi:hypothetical protein GDO86_014603 [Hymenochirus boettgeri]|uniref:Uncharacterized protein n=1 Tax=Hymenochirus boettgeri TaxID=247094 RepID=A0A8T2JV84_9PIPI|nr:hypothetical protein GDO86_014603 [Hymenochirus boettgeri]
MASADLRDELNCPICTDIYTDPVTLPCGHNYCQGCIEKTWAWQKGVDQDPSCPECRRGYRKQPELKKNVILCNISEQFRSTTNTEHHGTGIYCTYCIHSTVPAVKSCLHCEASLCDSHVRAHRNRKCYVHHELLKYYCWEDGACVCASCCLTGDHRGHKVELLGEMTDKKKGKLRDVLGKLTLEREETERRIQRLQENRDVMLEAHGEKVSEISRQEEENSLTLTNIIQQLEIKKEEQSRKICQIEELCSMADPFTFLQERESFETALSDTDGGDYKRRKIDSTPQDLIPETFSHMAGQQATDMLLDIDTAGDHVSVSPNGKTVSYEDKCYKDSHTGRFQVPQVLSTRSFPSGRHYWDVEGSESGLWRVGVSYPSIERGGRQSRIGENSESWCLHRWADNTCSVKHDSEVSHLTHILSCSKLRIFLDYEAGSLSLYELSDPIRHLHTFTATFTEPLHAAFWVESGAWVRIAS